MVIKQGDVYWVDLGEPIGSEPGYVRPYVVIQNNPLNQSRINTVVLCAITSNLNLAKIPGNVLLASGEANLSKRSVVNVSQLYTIDKEQLLEKIGSISWSHLLEVLEGVWQVIEPKNARQ